MPLPHPHKGQSETDFVSMCVGSDIMNKEFPNQKQRIATCYSLYKQAKKKKKDKKAELESSNVSNQPPNEAEFEPNWEETKAEIDKDGFIIL